MTTNKKGFTLIELLVVIVTIVILVGMLAPGLHLGGGESRRMAGRIGCVSHLKQIGLALVMYADDHDGQFPTGDNEAGLQKLIAADLLTNMKIFTCPSSKTQPSTDQTLEAQELDYCYKGGLTTRDVGPETGFVCDQKGAKTANHKKYGNVLFGNGHVDGFLGANWSKLNNSHNVPGGSWPPDPHDMRGN